MLCVYKLSNTGDTCNKIFLSHTCGVNVQCPFDKHTFNHKGNALSNTFGRKFLITTPFFALEFVLYVDRGLGLNISKYSNSLHA